MRVSKAMWKKEGARVLIFHNSAAPLFIKRKRKSKLKSLNQEDSTKEDEGINYPLDIWFIISEYIPPETVGKFARICRSSYYVTTTAKFWFHLYKMYHENVLYSPVQCVLRQHGLRTHVIRVLHRNYFRIILRHQINHLPDLGQGNSLVRRKCIHMWHEEQDILWQIFFKLKEISKIRNDSLKENKECNKKTEFNEVLEDVAVNPEEGCKVLRVSYIKCMLPPVIGLVLQAVSMSLMPDHRNHVLRLGFGTSIVPSTLTNEVILRDITDFCIFDWWDPYYPDYNAFSTIDHCQSDSV